ncbi:hypothetical protein A2W67_03535 [Candidatus Nomurabacteria bacterium RIFCSPLOWO2_02_40_28]|uniref:Uncharacterized protein n=2 Tax=Candidatus Nomuraibacteriota TaxID=1752729 RepID=A0A837HUY1_9BACT|nr:MAG: hypothetical protein UT27_C0004G0057 [Candidatus Nomurabacteria bacterium GW2011_GWD2_39_12]KKR20919.1 MAG: hypothetical protein UT51_C0001G0057 [Candidatus Nomurabacteria bacterium GW2011_GWC2_39_41]KKR37202.1 MAG: hypothetical protein UT70_C0002G0038 [Candidatus Nomurabacteria bacterium GW2011_GWE2_40_10]KKR38868.1 MAG: hypothetical protein UT73_C0001G0056 [Candidatus Nomurabacteria bacterium GW2011_GWB1_40_11]KKR40110.1 MAG: hypothetical protein UT74_C0002G0005 [Parcubacteria group b
MFFDGIHLKTLPYKAIFRQWRLKQKPVTPNESKASYGAGNCKNMEKKSQKVVCQNCRANFVIEPNDFGFYEKIKVPPPTFCPECRRQRRWAWRNNMSLYSRKCKLCDESVISIYSPDSSIIIYCNKCWWSDKWDPKSYGKEYDFSKPFFTQFKELMQKVPHMSVVNDDGIASVNCEYTHDWWFSKDCYMCFSGWNVQSVMYSFFMLQGRDMMDCNIIRSKSENLYECVRGKNSYQLKYSQLCLACIDSQFLYDCANCSNCFMCANLRNKKYHFKNKEYSKEEYEKILASYRLDTFSGVERAQKEYDEFILQYPRRYVFITHSLNCNGDHISFSKNLKNCFVAKNCENCRYSEFIGDANNPNKDCYDITMSGGVSESYEGVVIDHSQLNLFSVFSVKSQDLKYTQHCHNCKHCFGCVGLRNANYCIFNKQYTKEEYEKLMPKIIGHMNKMPYVDHIGNSYGYGEFYPIEMSPFGYNETYAPELQMFTREEAENNGYNWRENVQRTKGKETIYPEDIPNSVDDVADNILDEVLCCIVCERNYKIVPKELIFYRKLKIPIPRRCFYCRYQMRLLKTNSLKLWHRKCMKEGCKNEFETSYAPERPEIVYCEKCYQSEVY